MPDPAVLLGLSARDLAIKRTCVNCSMEYSIGDQHASDDCPTYANGCITHCLGCWLGVGPDEKQELGHVLRDIGAKLGPHTHLALMPIPRVHLSCDPIQYAGGVIFYPPGIVDMSGLQITSPDKNSRSLAVHLSAISGVDLDTVCQHATVAFPAPFDWASMMNTGHAGHMELIRRLSEHVDEICLDFLRYRLCSIDRLDALPGRAGQLQSNHMMASAVLYNAARCEGRIIAGSAFTHFIVRGLGLPLEPIRDDGLPGDGEVGLIARRALALYRLLLEADAQTTKLIQALALLDFMACPS